MSKKKLKPCGECKFKDRCIGWWPACKELHEKIMLEKIKASKSMEQEVA
jgi:hypothetical protein